jgi:hypothetical protein
MRPEDRDHGLPYGVVASWKVASAMDRIAAWQAMFLSDPPTLIRRGQSAPGRSKRLW